MKHHTIVSLYLFILSTLTCTNGCRDNEREALLSFKSLLKDPSNRLASWQGRNCCSWHGILCSTHSLNVVSVNLRNPNPDSLVMNSNSKLVSTSNLSMYTAIEGTISPSLFTLSHLVYLDLSFNNFMFSNIPNGLSNLTRLIYLNVSNAMFHGSITTQLANLTSLRHLDLSCSYNIPDTSTISYNLSSSRAILVGSMSTYTSFGSVSSSDLNWLSGLYNLRFLTLSGVDLYEASQVNNWAEPMSNLYELRFIELSNCNINGRIPIFELLNLTSLVSLVLDNNFLDSTIPNQLANLTSLSTLDLSGSNLHGTLPYLPQIRTLKVGTNPSLAIDLGSMFGVPWPHLETLDIQMTQVVSGSLPTSFANASSLVYFSAASCSIEGPIPSSLYNLSKLQVLFLDFNHITGHLSESIASLNRLRYLSLFENSLDGPIPDSICKVSSLQYIHLGGNLMTGTVPDCISELTNLSVFYITNNNMSGIVPSLMALFQKATPSLIGLGLSGLTVKLDQQPFPQTFQPQALDLTSCRIGGRVPDFLSRLTEVEFLSLADNNLSGTIPPWLFNLPKLGYLDLSYNNLQGEVPPNLQLQSFFGPTTLNLAGNNLQGTIPQLPDTIEVVDLSSNNFTGFILTKPERGLQKSLMYLSFSDNNLFGPIPLLFCDNTNILMHLDLSNNRLSGTLPISLTNCTALVSLNLANNSLTGSMPHELKAMTNMSYLQLNGNHFSGPFPSFVQELRNLQVLNLGNNRFEGEIPRFIGNLRKLRILVLRFNYFNGSIPREIQNLGNLQFIDLSNNELLGDVPNELQGSKMLTKRADRVPIASLISFMYSGVELNIVTKGQSYELKAVFTDISGIDFSCNSLTGNIPQEIGLLSGLYVLNFSHNHLSGEIPTNIGGMRGLESLDLSFNNLSGEIPVTLASLDYLSVLNLSYNNLSGKVPNGLHFDTLYGDGSAYVGNKFLCGAPGGLNCSGINGSSSAEGVDVEDTKEHLLLYAIVFVGYGVGIWGFFLVLYLVNEKWRKMYWSTIDKIVLRIMQCM